MMHALARQTFFQKKKQCLDQLKKLSLVASKHPNMLSGRQNKPPAPPQLPLVYGGVVD